jgi:negative regulator of flagellin synthesis FlgM
MDMRISSNTIKMYEIQRTGKADSANRTSRAQERQDMVALSSHAKDYSTVRRTINNMPDIRAEKVADLQSQIQANTYNVTGMNVADKIFEKASLS